MTHYKGVTDNCWSSAYLIVTIPSYLLVELGIQINWATSHSATSSCHKNMVCWH